MSPAKERGINRPARGFWISLVLGLATVQPSCARMRTFLHGPEPPLGRIEEDPAKAAQARPKPPRSVAARRDPFARDDSRRLSGGIDPAPLRAPTTLTRTTAPPTGAGRAASDAARPIAVALGTPSPIPPAPTPVAAANPSPKQPAGATRNPTPAPTPTLPAHPPKVADRSQPKADAPLPPAEAIVAAARTRLESVATYQMRVTRQERVNGILQEPETVLLSIRRNPKAVRIEWPDGPHKGREVLYAAGAGDGLMHVNMADALLPVKTALPPDSPLALANSRHPITEAGFDTIVANLEAALKRQKEANPTQSRFAYEGTETPSALDRPCHKLVEVRPNGETWVVYLDAQTYLPTLVQGKAANGDLLEHYLFRDLTINPPELAQADAFDFKARWNNDAAQAGGGFLNRLARSTTPGAKPQLSLPR
jgi:hypothetical protein